MRGKEVVWISFRLALPFAANWMEQMIGWNWFEIGEHL